MAEFVGRCSTCRIGSGMGWFGSGVCRWTEEVVVGEVGDNDVWDG